MYLERNAVFLFALHPPTDPPFTRENTHHLYSGLIGPLDAEVDAAVNWSDVRAAAIAEVIR